MKMKRRAERTIKDFQYYFDKYLVLYKWTDRPLNEIRKSECRDLHRKISENHGKVTADHVMRSLRAAYNFAQARLDDDDDLRFNPVKAVTFHGQEEEKEGIPRADLPGWWRDVQALKNPLRREMFTLGLLSGLRPGNLCSIRKEWIDLEERKICFPKEVMKNRKKAFDLPLSKFMIQTIKRALDLGDTLHDGSPWLFPSRSNKTGKVIAAGWYEKGIVTGHPLRHTYRYLAADIKVPGNFARHLLHHKLDGMDAVYENPQNLFTQLQAEQERVSRRILAACQA